MDVNCNMKDGAFGIAARGKDGENTELEYKMEDGQRSNVKEAQTVADKSCCQYGIGQWCTIYFWEGQDIEGQLSPKPASSGSSWKKRLFAQRRKIIGFLIPASFFHFFWWAFFIKYDLWYLFSTELDNYKVSITMVFGSMIAGMTSVGGGAVAYPVMTLALNITASDARDFSLMIQSCGMTAASFSIFYMRVCLERHALVWSSLGGVGGMIFGLHVVDPALDGRTKKLGFVSIWFAFGIVLLILNRTARRRTFTEIPDFGWWPALILAAFGFVGGVFSAISGSGIDICTFMVLTLLFRVSEKTATPTSVILMAGNTVLGFYWRAVMLQRIRTAAWHYLAVCIPVVVLGAPLGSVVGTHLHRLVLAALVILLTSASLISAYVIIRPTDPALIGGCVGLIAGCLLLFAILTVSGQRILVRYEKSLTEKRNGDVIGSSGKQPEVVAGSDGQDNVAFVPGEENFTPL